MRSLIHVGAGVEQNLGTLETVLARGVDQSSQATTILLARCGKECDDIFTSQSFAIQSLFGWGWRGGSGRTGGTRACPGLTHSPEAGVQSLRDRIGEVIPGIPGIRIRRGA